MLVRIEDITHRPELNPGGVNPGNRCLDKSRLRESRIGKTDVEGLQNKKLVIDANARSRAAGSVQHGKMQRKT